MRKVKLLAWRRSGDLALQRRIELSQQQQIAHRQLWLHIRGYPRGKIRASRRIEWHRQHAAQHAAIEGGHPFRAVVGPQQKALTPDDSASLQQRREPARDPRQPGITGRVPAVAHVMHYGSSAAVAAKVVEQ